jgi:AcrR family transcriptional regulator
MVENKSRGRGRPRSFDENDVLDRAMRVFWAKGYDGASLDDLSAAMGIGRPSMYGAFGDKDAVFMRCLERFAETVAAGPLRFLEEEANVRNAVRAYMRGVACYTVSDSCRGCMVGAVASLVDDDKVREFVVAKVAASEEAIARRLRRAIAEGELPDDFPVERRARRLANAMLALSARARQGACLDTLMEDAEDAVEMALTL